MTVWLDAQLSPSLAPWLASTFRVESAHVRDLGLRNAEDREIFEAARRAEAIVKTKDRDFVELLARLGPPPQVLLISAGNTSNARMREVLTAAFATGLALLQAGEPLVEISDAVTAGGAA